MTGPASIQALVFDFDGLILDTETSDYTTVRDEFDAHGIELTFDAWQHTIGRADHPHWLDWLETELGRPLEDREAVRARRNEKHRLDIEAQAVRPGVTDLLETARRAGVATAVASSSPRCWVVGHLERIGLLDRFDAVRTRDDVERAKPWPDVFLAAARAIDCDPETCVAFEDSHHGSKAAKAAGMVCVVVPNGMTDRQDFAHVDLVVASLGDVHLEGLAALVAARRA